MKFKNPQPGVYVSVCGRVVIQKHTESHSYGAKEVSWSVSIDDVERGIVDQPTKKEAIAYAIKCLSKEKA